MKEIKLYTCEICETQYYNKLTCEKCEKNHKKDLQIVNARYLSYKQDESGMPVAVTIVGKDGQQYTYRR